jgi:hypothetical protein
MEVNVHKIEFSSTFLNLFSTNWQWSRRRPWRKMT